MLVMIVNTLVVELESLSHRLVVSLRSHIYTRKENQTLGTQHNHFEKLEEAQ